MKDQMMMLWQVECSGSLEFCQSWVELLESEEGTPFSSPLSISFFEVDETPEFWTVHVLYPFQPKIDQLCQVYPLLQKKEAHVQVCPLPPKDWVTENRNSFPPLTVGPFYIHGSHTLSLPLKNKIRLEINATTAFGTGYHATTQGCLESLVALHTAGYRFKNALDLGCGTGILAMACSRLFNSPVLATDCDPQALEITRENLINNTLSDSIQVLESDGFKNATLQKSGPFDLILSNILARPLVELSPLLSHHTALGGFLILSGFYESQMPEIQQAYNPHFQTHSVWTKDQWTTLTLHKTALIP